MRGPAASTAMQAFPALFLVFFLLLAGAIAYYGWKAAQQRKKDLAALAQRLGFRYAESDFQNLSSRFGVDFPAFQEGSNRYAYNVLFGRTGERDVWMFDHHHETHSTNSKGQRQTHHHHHSFVVLNHEIDLDRIELRPEGLFDKVKAAFGFDDIDFESAEFSRLFHVQARDRKIAYDVFHPGMMEFLLERRDLRLTTARDLLLVRRGTGLLKVPVLETTLMDAMDFLSRLPRYLRRDRSAES